MQVLCTSAGGAGHLEPTLPVARARPGLERAVEALELRVQGRRS